jgi:hypothetical protein
MLDPKFKNLCLIFSYVNKEQRMYIVEQYDKRTLFPMLVKSYNHLHPIEDVAFGFANQDAYED